MGINDLFIKIIVFLGINHSLDTFMIYDCV